MMGQLKRGAQDPPGWLAAGMPCLIKEVLYAPPCPPEVAKLWEVALVHHNSSNYDLAVRTYLQGQHEWESMLVKQEERVRKADKTAGRAFSVRDPREPDNLPQISPEAQIFIRLAVASVFDSAAADERALAELQEAMRLCVPPSPIALPQQHPIQAMVDSMLGAIYTHLCQFDLASDHFLRALEVRENQPNGQKHVDTGLVLNNIGVCLHCLDRTRDALVMYYRAEEIFKNAFRIEHPRLVTVQRNIAKARQYFLKGAKFTLPQPKEVLKVQRIPALMETVRAEEKKGGKKKGGGKKKKK